MARLKNMMGTNSPVEMNKSAVALGLPVTCLGENLEALGDVKDYADSNPERFLKVAAAVCHELASAIADHEKQQRGIQEKYDRIHGQTAVLAVAAAGAALIPAAVDNRQAMVYGVPLPKEVRRRTRQGCRRRRGVQ